LADPSLHADGAPRGNARHFIVLLALLQGLMLYIASYGSQAGWWPFALLGGRVTWYTLVLTVPTVMLLSVVRLGDSRFWQQAAGLAGVFAALAAWAAWAATGQPPVDSEAVLLPFGWTVALGAFIATPYLQARLAEGRWCAPYPRLFQDAWQNTLTLLLAGVFVGLSWSLLTLWAALFNLVGVAFFEELFKSRPFAYLASGLLFGLGVLIGRTQHRAVFTARSVLFALFKGLLPVLSLVAVMFLLTLPFTGLAELWTGEGRGFRRTGVAFVMALLVAHQVLFLNAVHQDGTQAMPYPRWLRALVLAATAALPVFALLGLWAVGLRIGQYGWTPDRFWALLALAVLLLYAAGYGLAIGLRRGGWLRHLPRINVTVSLVILALVVLGNSPVLDPHRLSAGSQLARLQAMPADALNRSDIDALRFDYGRHGLRALQALRAHAGAAGAADTLTQIDSALARQSRRHFTPAYRERGQALSADRLRQPPNASAAIPAGLVPAIQQHRQLVDACALAPQDCWVLALDLNFDGADEQLVCALTSPSYVRCWAFHREDGAWVPLATLSWFVDQDLEAVERSVRQGTLRVQRPEWGEVVPEGASGVVVRPGEQ